MNFVGARPNLKGKKRQFLLSTDKNFVGAQPNLKGKKRKITLKEVSLVLIMNIS